MTLHRKAQLGWEKPARDSARYCAYGPNQFVLRIRAFGGALGLALSLVAFAGGLAFAQDGTEGHREQMEKYLEASRAGRYEEAFDAWSRWIEIVPQEKWTNEELRDQAEEILVSEAYRGLTEVPPKAGSDTDSRLSEWKSRLTRLRPPKVPSRIAYAEFGFLRLFEAARLFNAGNRGEAKQALAEGKHYLNGCTAPEMDARFKRAARKAIALVEKGVEPQTSVGDYVTSRGFFQDWIGRVAAVSGATYTVRLTYVSEGSTQKKGQKVTLRRGEFKELSAISVDALLRGWR